MEETNTKNTVPQEMMPTITTIEKETKVVKKKYSPDQDTRDRREDVLKAIKITGGYGVPIKELAKKHHVVERTIYKDIDYILGKVPKPQIQLIATHFKISFESVLSQAHKMLFDSDKKVQKDGAELILKTAEVYTDLLERYGYKEKIADKVDVRSLGLNVNLDKCMTDEELDLVRDVIYGRR